MTASQHNAPVPASDIRAIAWVPPVVRPLVQLSRWDRPVGIWLLFWPALWGLVMATRGLPPLSLIMLFFIGAVMLRGAGCTINDILDRNLDKAVARTASRPLAAGHISVCAAWLWLTVQLLIGAFILFALPTTVWLWGVAAVPLIVLYPLMKRITWWPQLWLGMTFNWGLLLGAAALDAMPGFEALLFYAGAIFWTVGYDTIYALQDVDDDARVGVKSSARAMGAQTIAGIAVCYTAAGTLWLAGVWQAGLSPVCYAVMLVVAGHLVWQVRHLRAAGVQQARRLFLSNIWVGLALAGALVAGYAL